MYTNVTSDQLTTYSATPTSASELENILPAGYSLGANFPNPFNPGTRIQYSLPRATHVKLTIYSLLGREVATLVDDVMPAGVHIAKIDARDLASGVFVCQMRAGSYVATRGILLIR
jgi:hypothetical protein